MPLRIPPSSSRAPRVLAQRDIGRGVHKKANQFAIPPGMMRILENFILVEDGSLLGRRGTVRKNAASLGAGAINGSARVYFAAGNQFLANHNGTVYKSTDNGATFSSSLAGLNATSPWWAWQYLTFAYASNKVDAKKKYDGTTWTDWGIAAPSGVPAGAAGAAGTPNGTYSIKYTYVTATIESNPSPKSADFALTNQKGSISGITVGPAGTTKRKIYGFKNGISSVYQLIGEINDNTTTSVTDFITTDQSSWTTTVTSKNTPPPVGPWITVLFRNRLWIFGDGRRGILSEIFMPEAFPANYYLDLPFSFNDEVTAAIVVGEQLIVHGHQEAFYIVGGDSPSSFVVRKVHGAKGCPSAWAVAEVLGAAAYLSRFGLRLIDGAGDRVFSQPIEPHFTGVYQDVEDMNYAAADKATLDYYDRLKALVVSFPVGASVVNNMTWWRFLEAGGFVQDTRASRMFLIAGGKGDAGDLFSWDVNDGILRQWDPDGVYTDDGVAISARMKTGALDDGSILTKVFRWFTARARPSGVVFQVNAEVDQGAESDSFTLNIATGAVVGVAVVGVAMLAAELEDFEESFLASMKGRTIAYDIHVTYSEFFQLAQLYTTYDVIPAIRRRVVT